MRKIILGKSQKGYGEDSPLWAEALLDCMTAASVNSMMPFPTLKYIDVSLIIF